MKNYKEVKHHLYVEVFQVWMIKIILIYCSCIYGCVVGRHLEVLTYFESSLQVEAAASVMPWETFASN